MVLMVPMVPWPPGWAWSVEAFPASGGEAAWSRSGGSGKGAGDKAGGGRRETEGAGMSWGKEREVFFLFFWYAQAVIFSQKNMLWKPWLDWKWLGMGRDLVLRNSKKLSSGQRPHTRTHTHTYTHMHTYTYIHVHIHTHTHLIDGSVRVALFNAQNVDSNYDGERQNARPATSILPEKMPEKPASSLGGLVGYILRHLQVRQTGQVWYHRRWKVSLLAGDLPRRSCGLL